MIRQLLGLKSPLQKFAKLEDPSRFAREFGMAEVHVLQLPILEGFDPAGLTDEEFQDKLVAQLQKAATAMQEGTDLEFFSFAASTSQAVPVFSTERTARRFAKRYVTETKRVLPFAVGEGPVGAVVAQIGAGKTLVVDPGTSNEWELSASQMEALRQRWS